MDVWGGWYRTGMAEKFVIRVSEVAGKCECGDCSGFGLFELPDDNLLQCVMCRGTGYQWVGI